LNHAVSTVV